MENKQNSGNGFLIGLVLGAGIALLFSTEKGRKILKTLSEEGLSRVAKWEEMWDEELAEEEEEGFDEPIYNEEAKVEEAEALEQTEQPKVVKEVKAKSPKVTTESRPRRFFHGIPRHFKPR